MIDSHTHLDHLPTSAGDAVAAAGEAGVSRLLTVGTDLDSCRAAIAAAEEFDGVWAAIGLHPNRAADYDDATGEALAELAAHPRCAAIGETGLDYYRQGATRDEQLLALRGHADLARRTSKPLVVHTREADQDTLDALRDHADGLEVLLHCFSMPARLDECLERGYWISFAGNCTYPRNSELAESVTRVPLERLLVETDAPYLSPQPVRKHRNQPAFVVHTARFVAERHGIEYEALEAAVEANAARLFGW
ncbi:MAG: TatD family hydrolase [Solirubrobacterales bacterium]|nr:TatD family hydrolase [Solirubrobacterales bacterium]